MLVLSRKPGERIHVGSSITITVIDFRGNQMRIGIDAPSDVSILREELVRAREILCAYGGEAPVTADETSGEQLLEELRTLCARLTRLEQPETLRQQAKEIYHQTEERLLALMERSSAALRMLDLVDSSADSITSKTLEGLVVSWNGSAERLYGYTAGEMKGRPVSLLYPPDGAEELAGIMATVKRGECLEAHEAVRVRKGGGQIEVSVSHSPIMDDNGRIVGASAIARDISDRKRPERGLQQRGEQLQVEAGRVRQ